jgi:pyruvate dehydrogenase E1 component beta subunit
VSGDDRILNMIAACHEALECAMELDDTVFLLGEDIADPNGGGSYGVTAGLSTRFGLERVRTTPISEQAIMGAAIGAAMAGMRPVAEIMLLNFITVAMDQLYNHAAKLRYMSGGQLRLPMTVRAVSGAGFQFGAQHSDMLEAWLAHTPGLKVAIPSTPADAKGLLLSCIFDDNPCVFIENAVLYLSGTSGPVAEGDARVALGQAARRREGTDVTIVGYGRPIIAAEAAAEACAADGISAEVIDLRTVSPIDWETVFDSVGRTGRSVVVHEAVQAFGVGAEISARISEELGVRTVRVGAPFVPVPYAAALESAYVPDVDRIAAAVRAACASDRSMRA